MIFSLEHCKMIAAGKKTQTIRISKDSETWDGSGYKNEDAQRIDTVMINDRHKWQVGKDYAVQTGRGKRGLWWSRISKDLIQPHNANDISELIHAYPIRTLYPLRILITYIDLMELHNMTPQDFYREGGYHYKTFMRLWDNINRKRKWDSNPVVWRLQFAVV